MIFIAGGTGFVGAHLVEALLSQGLSVRILVRDQKKLESLKERWYPLTKSENNIEFHIGDITDRASLKGALKGIDILVHLVGIIEGTQADFKNIHVRGTENLLEEAVKSDLKLFFYQSALGASLKGETPYQKTKAMAEELVIHSGISYIIFRPSLIIGKGDGFTQRLSGLINKLPVIPIPGDGNTRFQPIYVEDLIRCFLISVIERKEKNKIFELGGPEHLTYNEMLKDLMEVMAIKKPFIHVPIWLVKTGLPAGKVAKKLGIEIPLPTVDQLKLLKKDNITDPDIIQKTFGFKPLTFREALRKIFA